MSTCILHAGMPKTGTSSIQASLSGFADGRFVWYRDPKGRPNHTPAIFGLVGAVRPSGNVKRDVPELDARGRVDQALRALGGRSLVISGEGMPFLTSTQLQELMGYFQGRVGTLTVVAYVRPPVGFRTSLARATKGGMLRSLELDHVSTGYRERFEKFDQVLGRDNVLLWKFDPASFPSGCVVRDFCNRLGIDFPAERIVRENESLSREAVALLYTYHIFGTELGSRSMNTRQRVALTQRLAMIGKAKFRFSPDLVRPFLERNRSDIEWMEQRLGQSLAEDWYEHRPGDVHEDWDLLRPDSQAVGRLRDLLGADAPKGVKGETPGEVALLVHALRGEDAPDQWRRRAASTRRERDVQLSAPSRQRDALNATDLVAEIERTHPKLLNAVPREQAQQLVSCVFKHIRENLARTEQGIVNYAGLGRFQVVKIDKEMAGKKDSRTRVVFRPAHSR